MLRLQSLLRGRPVAGSRRPCAKDQAALCGWGQSVRISSGSDCVTSRISPAETWFSRTWNTARAASSGSIAFAFGRRAPIRARNSFARADLFRLSGRMPGLVIDAADQHRELVAELSGLIGRQAIAQAMLHRAQGSPASLRAQHPLDFLEPCIGFMQRFVEHFDAGQAHGSYPGMRAYPMLNRAQRAKSSQNVCAQKPGIALTGINSLHFRAKEVYSRTSVLRSHADARNAPAAGRGRAHGRSQRPCLNRVPRAERPWREGGNLGREPAKDRQVRPHR